MRHRGLLVQLPLSLWIPQDLWNCFGEEGSPWCVHLPVNTPTPHSTAQLSREEQQRWLSHWNLASFLGSISELLTFGMGQCYLDANKCISLVWRHVPWGRSRDWGEVCDKPMERTSGDVWPWDEFQFFDFPGRKQGPLEAFSFWIDKWDFPPWMFLQGFQLRKW